MSFKCLTYPSMSDRLAVILASSDFHVLVASASAFTLSAKLEVDQTRSPTCLILTKIPDRVTKYEQKTLCESSSAAHIGLWIGRSTQYVGH
jgi:hypothetical protein